MLMYKDEIDNVIIYHFTILNIPLLFLILDGNLNIGISIIK